MQAVPCALLYAARAVIQPNHNQYTYIRNTYCIRIYNMHEKSCTAQLNNLVVQQPMYDFTPPQALLRSMSDAPDAYLTHATPHDANHVLLACARCQAYNADLVSWVLQCALRRWDDQSAVSPIDVAGIVHSLGKLEACPPQHAGPLAACLQRVVPQLRGRALATVVWGVARLSVVVDWDPALLGDILKRTRVCCAPIVLLLLLSIYHRTAVINMHVLLTCVILPAAPRAPTEHVVRQAAARGQRGVGSSHTAPFTVTCHCGSCFGRRAAAAR